MKKFISKLLTILLTFTLCFFLFACAPSDNGNSGGLGEGGGESGGGGNNPPAQNSLITPAEMQAKVDAITESETLKLDSGNFDVLTIKIGANMGQTLNGKPLYKRELSDVIIQGKLDGTSKTTFLKTFKIETKGAVDGVSVITKTTIKTLKFKDVNFSENTTLIFNALSSELSPVVIENLVFDNVTINNQNMPNVNGRHGISFDTNCGAIKNVTFTNCQILNVNSQNASGIHFNNSQGIEKITVENSKIAGVNYNAIQVNKFKGELTINNVTASFTGSRALRIDDVKQGSKITITNNTFSSVGSDEVFKLSNVDLSTVLTISNNTLNGNDLTYDDYVIA